MTLSCMAIFTFFVYRGNFGPTGSGGYGGQTYAHGTAGGHSSYGGQGVVTSGGTTYHGSFGSPGTITSGHSGHGIIGTDVLTSGTVYTHGDSSGTVYGGTNHQGGVITGVTQPGYVQTNSGAPGYSVNNGVKTVYSHTGSKTSLDHGIPQGGVFLTGTPAPGVILHGHSTPGTYLTGQTSPGLIHGGGFNPGVTIGDSSGGHYYTGGAGSPVHNGATGPSIYSGGSGTSTGRGGTAGPSIYSGSRGKTTFNAGGTSPNYQRNPFLTVTEDMGYKTNEYHDNGGRGTIRYNNGEVVRKYTEDDVKEHHNQFGTLPTFGVGIHTTSSGNQNYQTSGVAGESSEGGFTKTGPTKTGITTAQVGGSGSYVAGSPQQRPFTGSQNIGANAFTSSNQGYATSTIAPSISYTSSRTDYSAGIKDDSKIHQETGKDSSSGYYYGKPEVQLNTFTGSTKSSLVSEDHDSTIFSSSARPFVDVHVYNNPSVVTTAPITASPAVINAYSYGKSSTVRKFPAVSSTASPIGFTTGPLENFRTTMYGAARIPSVLSTVQPVFDTGYKTVVSSTALPINVNTDSFGYRQTTGYRTDSLATRGNGVLDVNVSFQRPDLSTQGQYDNGIPAVPAEIPSSGYSRRPSVGQSHRGSERPAIQQQQVHRSIIKTN